MWKEKFTVRGATMADVEAAVALFNTCSQAMIGRPETTVNQIRNEWQTPRFDLATSTRLVFSPEGQLVGYVEVWDTDPIPVNVWVWGRVHPDFEGQEIGTRLMAWAEKRARQAISRVPEGTRVAMRCSTFSTWEPAKQLFAARDMKVTRHFWRMVIDLEEAPPAPRWPAGIPLRTFQDEPDLHAVYRAVDDAFQDHWGHVDQPEEEAFRRWQHWTQNDDEFDATLWFLAMDDDEIAGISLCRARANDDPDMGWVSTLGVRRPWRRQGLALALLHHTFGEFYRRGRKRVGLGVDASSLTGATKLYEKAGMHVTRQFDTYEKELRSGQDLSTRTLAE